MEEVRAGEATFPLATGQGLRSLRPTYPDSLPVSRRRDEIVAAMRQHQVIVVAGETGSGKTTQLPKMCLDAGFGRRGRIACTQPRRVAALSVSRRVAEELGVEWGREVGCKIRFTDRTSRQTVIKMMTDGMLLAEVQSDPRLSEYEVVILDEAHERSLNIDFLLGYLNQLRTLRPDLRLIITSATIDTGLFSQAFGGAPVIEVSGRTYPVEVRYRPLGLEREDGDDLSYVDAAVEGVEVLLGENRPGDFLVFMPTERDIRETVEQLLGRLGRRCEILPLFGRLSNADQQRIFSGTQRRKIVVATNIAETSITIPGIRYVVDTGLARISRYAPQTRTLRLPVEPIARSNADQRSGRCGRVSNGVCLRLYSQAEYEARPRFAQPEILRANLAAVILRLKAFKLGEVETFPFIDRPSERAVRSGYQLLQDLGALDGNRELTEMGRNLAALPVDPTVGRMLLQAVKERCVPEVLVIAAALSVQDPRERPAEHREEAQAMHRRFNHPESDFLTLWNIWEAYHTDCERLSLRQLKKFCATHFLSFPRMREWREIHDQLGEAMERFPGVDRGGPPAEYDQIHRALLSGLVTNVAVHEENNLYRAPHNRQVNLFPGSVLFDRSARKREHAKGRRKSALEEKKPRQPTWILAGEWMETTRVFARTCARVDPTWVLSAAAHLCRSSFGDPAWVPSAGRVLVKERILLHGLELATRKVDYGRIDPARATEIFLRSALVEADVRNPPPFLLHNQELREKVEDVRTRVRQPHGGDLDERIYRFYAARIENCSSLHDLNRWLREQHRGEDRVLRLSQDDLVADPEALNLSPQDFPDGVTFNGVRLRLAYNYRPGEEDDGVTVEVPASSFGSIDPALLDWAVPGFVTERVDALLRGLPKEIRVRLFPIAEKVAELSAALQPSTRPMTESLAVLIWERYRLRISPADWNLDAIPSHLRPRLTVLDSGRRPIASGRDWHEVAARFRQESEQTTRERAGSPSEVLWNAARQTWERPMLTAWTFGDLPLQIPIGQVSGIPVHAFAGLLRDGSGVHLRLFPTAEEAERASRDGLQALAIRVLGREVAWAEKDFRRAFDPLKLRLASLGPVHPLLGLAWTGILNEVFPTANPLPLTESRFSHLLDGARRQLPSAPIRRADLIGSLLADREAALSTARPPAWLQTEVARIAPSSFLSWSDARLAHVPRHLKALRRRVERARQEPLKDAAKAARIHPFEVRWRALPPLPAEDRGAAERRLHLGFLLEEFRVSVFSPELGTAVPVSEKRLDLAFADLEPPPGPA